MKSMELYKHRNNTDVAILVLKSYFIPEKGGYKVKVRWMNIVNPKNVFDVGVGVETVFIKTEDMQNWRPYEQQ